MSIINLIIIPSNLLTPIKASNDSYVIITGAASGIGKEIAYIYGEKGFSLILIDINPKLIDLVNILQQKYQGQNIKYITIDISILDNINKIYNTIINEWKIYNIDILVNNAGFGMTEEFLNCDINFLNKMILVNVNACINLAHIFGRHMVKRNKGRITQLCSLASYIPGSHAACYHGTKAMIRSWAKAFNHELIATGVGVTIVSPSGVQTNFITTSNSQKSVIFTSLKFLTHTPQQVAEVAVDATLQGKEEVIPGMFWDYVYRLIRWSDENFLIIGTKFLWQDPQQHLRSPYKLFKYS